MMCIVINGKVLLLETGHFLDAKNVAKHFRLGPKKGLAQNGALKRIRYAHTNEIDEVLE